MIVTDLFENTPDETTARLCAVSEDLKEAAWVVLNTEHTLALYRENTLLHRFVCSPSFLGALCAGWLHTEGYTASSVEVSRDGHSATALCSPASPKVPEKRCVTQAVQTTVEEMLALFHEASDKYARSHGIHECVIKGNGWHIIRTDIGRHNAIDKAVGAAILAGYDLRGAVMFSSGRINVQTVEKALRCGIGCLMSKAVITQQALTLAKEAGLKVLFCVKESGYISL